MPFSLRLFFTAVLLEISLASLSAQVYLPDLKNEDLNAVDLKLKSLGATYKTEPVVGLYLTVGRNPEFLGRLLERGANPSQKAPALAWSPLSYAVMQNLGTEIVSRLLQAGANLDSSVAGTSGNVIDAALDKQELLVASLLVKSNQRRPKAVRIVASERYKDYPAFFLDDLIEVRNILRYSDLANSQVWNLALAGNSRKVLKYLMDFQIEPNFNAPGKRYENTVGCDLLASNLDLLKYLLSDGLAPEKVNFDKLYVKLLTDKNLDSIRALRGLDGNRVRPALYKPALSLGPDYLRAVTNNLDDFTKPASYEPGALSALLFGEPSAGDQPLLLTLYEKTDFATVLPMLKVNATEATINGLYRYAFAKKKSDLLKGLLSIDANKARPDLYAIALDSGLDSLKAITHDLADFTNPALFADANQNGGRENLTALLFKAGNRRTLLESIFEKSDFSTVLPIIQALNPPAELLAAKEYSAAYETWLDRSRNEMTSFGFLVPGVKGTVAGEQIMVVVPDYANLAALAAEFTVSGGSVTVGNLPQVSGETENDFTSPVVYTVTAADGTKRTYTVSVTVLPPENPSTETAE